MYILFHLVCFIEFDKLYTYVHFMCMLYFKKHWKNPSKFSSFGERLCCITPKQLGF